MKVFDKFSCLLRYPEDAALFRRLIQETAPYSAENEDRIPVSDDIKLLQEEYVEIFDFSPKTSLTLASHTAKSDSEIMELMDCLNTLLNYYGIRRTDNSSPDYLPDILSAYQKVLDSEEDEEALEFINNLILDGCRSSAGALEKKRSIYLTVLKRLCSALESEVHNV